MFDIFSEFINKRALKRAMKEVEIEDIIAQSKTEAPQREYKTNLEAEGVKPIRISSPLSKPETEAVDLKNFKNWRNTEKVESKITTEALSKKFSFLDDDDDEGEQPSIENPVGTKKKNIVDMILPSNDFEKREEKKESNIADFFKEKYGVKKDDVNENKNEHKEHSSIRNSVKVSLNDLLKRKNQETDTNLTINEVKEEKEVKFEENKKDSKENKIKVEVVDFDEPKTKTTKKTVNRKPRGKNKRKFDADVISSIDWK